MAQGDLTVFQAFSETLGQEIHDFDNDVLKLGIIDDGSGVPSASQASPAWSTYSGDEITAGNSGYVADGNAVTTSWDRLGGVSTLSGTSYTITKGSTAEPFATSGATQCYGILYNNSATAKNGIAFIDLGEIDLTLSNVVIQFNGAASGEAGTILTVTVS